MKSLTLETLSSCLDMHGNASKENDPQASAELFARNAKYYETPFDEPMIGRDAIRKYWDLGAQNLRDKESTHEVLSVKDNLGIAHWQSNFTVVESDKRFALECLFVVEFGEDELCQSFHEWWRIQEVNSREK